MLVLIVCYLLYLNTYISAEALFIILVTFAIVYVTVSLAAIIYILFSIFTKLKCIINAVLHMGCCAGQEVMSGPSHKAGQENSPQSPAERKMHMKKHH